MEGKLNLFKNYCKKIYKIQLFKKKDSAYVEYKRSLSINKILSNVKV